MPLKVFLNFIGVKMNKGILTFVAAFIMCGFLFAGCNNHKRVVEVASINTYTVVLVDRFSNDEAAEINSAVASIFSELLTQVAPVTTNTINVTINITNEHVGPSNHNNGNGHRAVLVSCGDDNKCSQLFNELRSILLNRDD
jgi:outer membrane murein-binding lipoprotein Lpp